jgi:hypothetical protein
MTQFNPIQAKKIIHAAVVADVVVVVVGYCPPTPQPCL